MKQPPRPVTAVDAGPSLEPSVAPGLYKDAIARLQKNDLDGAVQLFSRCLLADAKNCKCNRGLAITYAKRKETPSAVRSYELYLSHCPDASDADKVRQMLQAQKR